MKLILKAPAKLNLCLKVAGVRPDGFHELVTLMQPISLCDYLSFDLAADSLEFSCSLKELEGEHNLVVKAARDWFQMAELEPRAKIHLDKRVPLAAGIGGGSSDAAAALLGLNVLHDRLLKPETLYGLAAGLGSDVPFFLSGVTAWCTGKGEMIRPWPEFPNLHYVVINPGYEVSTPWVYRTYDLHWTNPGARNTITDHRSILGKWDGVLANDLEAATISAHPGISRLKAELKAVGAEGAMMSGSGPTVFGIFNNAAAAAKAADKLAHNGDLWVRACQGLTC
jgi:4-diphosphocytidyl-2-C-methyl-D-erythritol kinase